MVRGAFPPRVRRAAARDPMGALWKALRKENRVFRNAVMDYDTYLQLMYRLLRHENLRLSRDDFVRFLGLYGTRGYQDLRSLQRQLRPEGPYPPRPGR